MPPFTELSPGQLSDEVLATRIAQGDRTALEALFDRHAATVLGISLKVTGDRAAAEDVLQETFWKVWQSAMTYEPQRGAFTGWLFRIARNLAIDSLRRRNVRPQAISEMANSDDIVDQMPDPDTDVVEQAQSVFVNKRVHEAMISLPGEQRQVIELAYFYGMTRQEIAKITGAALGTIHTRARLGLQKLRELLEEEEFEA